MPDLPDDQARAVAAIAGAPGPYAPEGDLLAAGVDVAALLDLWAAGYLEPMESTPEGERIPGGRGWTLSAWGAAALGWTLDEADEGRPRWARAGAVWGERGMVRRPIRLEPYPRERPLDALAGFVEAMAARRAEEAAAARERAAERLRTAVRDRRAWLGKARRPGKARRKKAEKKARARRRREQASPGPDAVG